MPVHAGICQNQIIEYGIMMYKYVLKLETCAFFTHWYSFMLFRYHWTTLPSTAQHITVSKLKTTDRQPETDN